MAEGDLTGTWREYLLADGVVGLGNLEEGVAAALAGGFTYVYSTNTEATDPGAGKLKFDKAVLAEAIALRISETDDNGNAIAAWLAQFDDSTNTIKGTLTIAKVGDPNAFAIFNISGALVDNGTWDSVSVAHVLSQGLVNNDVVTITFSRTGNVGEKGEAGSEGRQAGLHYTWLTKTGLEDPGAGKASLANVAGVKILQLSKTDKDGNAIGAFLAVWDDSTTTANRGTVIVRQVGSPKRFLILKIKSALEEEASFDRAEVSVLVEGEALQNEKEVTVEWLRTGDLGEKGATGTAGSPGALGWLWQETAVTALPVKSGQIGVEGKVMQISRIGAKTSVRTQYIRALKGAATVVGTLIIVFLAQNKWRIYKTLKEPVIEKEGTAEERLAVEVELIATEGAIGELEEVLFRRER